VASESLNPQSSFETANGTLQYDNEFWRFSLAAYGEAGVAEECLALQQAIGADINLLLFCAWTGARGIALGGDDIEHVMARVAAWQDHVVRPLRSVRQNMKGLKLEDSENFRARVKSIEIEAEQIEQAILFAYSERFRSTHKNIGNAIAENVRKYIELKSGQKSLATPVLIDAALRLRS
jgi:uncharacterized protein (TIGR02444 family)